MSGKPTVVPLHRADDISRCLRLLADDIDNGAVVAQECLCVLRNDTNTVRLYGWGDYRGQVAALGLLEAGKRCVRIETHEEG